MARTHQAFGKFGYFLTEPAIGSPSVEITLGGWLAFDKENRNAPLLTEDLMTSGEIDARVRDLKSDLDRAAESAKRALAKSSKLPKA